MTSRELVHATMEFRNRDGRVPRDLWTLPWADMYHSEKLRKIKMDFPSDMTSAPNVLASPTIAVGNEWKAGEYIDPWGCKFTNLIDGIVGEVKEPLVEDEEWEDMDRVHIPVELMDFDIDCVNAFCKNTEKFVNSGSAVRPFEQLQFIRGTENLYMDLVELPKNLLKFMNKMHTFYCDLVEKWAKTDVDGIQMLDDWGSQRSLLINPKLWERLFKPMYKDYIEIAKRHGKKVLMHSDGYTLDIYPHMIELGLDAFNTQIACMGVEQLVKYKGKITFWGEIDRQNLLPYGTGEEVERAVREVYENLWDNGGCIAQCEFGIGANPDNVYRVYQAWDAVRR